MTLRLMVAFVLGLANFFGGTLGLQHGMVLVVHDDGHLHLVHALTRHTHEHAVGSSHAPHDYSADAEHAALHAAILTDADTFPPRQPQAPAGHNTKRLLELPVLPLPLASTNPLLEPLTLTLMPCEQVCGITARMRDARLRTVVLVI